uniref:Uncharacterized protein n=1 Tax=viral metagenome TaxID=1070528 RepID=A0A6C0HA91_9ZZZZ
MNAFKNFSSSSKKTQQQKDPFIPKRETVVKFNQDEFPDLVDNTTKTLEKESKQSLDYKGASLINYGYDEEEEKKKPGWSYLTVDKNRKIQIENYKIHPKYINKSNKDPNWRNILGQLVTSWEKYKQKYIELYGDDCYNHMYEMPRDDYKHYDDEDEYNDEILSGDDQDYYYENPDDYDNYL